MSSLTISELTHLFQLNYQAYRDIWQDFANIYRSNPTRFAETLFETLPSINPKSLRIICYQLFTQGIGMDQVYSSLSKPHKLSRIPLESLMVLLKYKYPAFPEGDIFFLPILPDLDFDYLDFVLDVCTHLQIDLNTNNKSTGESCLIWAIKYGSLPLVQSLLCHRADPNRQSKEGQSPLHFAVDQVLTDDNVYLNIIRQLRRYGAKVDENTRLAIEKSSYQGQINRALYSGKSLEPTYCDVFDVYFSMDNIEDLVLLAELDPSIIGNLGNLTELFLQSIEIQQNKLLVLPSGFLTWPYYIDDSRSIQNGVCYLTTDDRPVAESPPGPDLVYKLALEDLDDLSKYQAETFVDLPTATPASFIPLSPVELGPSSPIMPLTTGPLVPTGSPRLPSL